MITLTAKITLISGDNSTLSGISELEGNNISSRVPLGEKKAVRNPFIIGASKLGDGSTFSDCEGYFIGSQLSNEYGFFENPYSIVVSGTNISALTICFDDKQNRHPYSIIVDGNVYEDNDPNFTLKLEAAETHTIYIDNWNAPNYPLVISGIYAHISIDLDHRKITSIESSIMERGDNELPSWGIISNGGSLTFNDNNGEIIDYIEQNLLQSGSKVEIYLNNTLAKTKEIVGTFYTENWDYDNDNRSVSLSFKDKLEEWQDIEGESYLLNEYNAPRRIYDVFNRVASYARQKGFEISVSSDVVRIMENTTTPNLYMEKGSLWENFKKICEICGFYIYQNENGICVVSTEFN